MIQNSTTANFLNKNSSDTFHGNSNASTPLAFFSVEAANPDGMRHTQIVADDTTGRVQYNWEDLYSMGDSDFNDVVMTVHIAAQSNSPPATIHAPGTGDTSVTLSSTLKVGTQKSTAATTGDIGVYYADDADGTVNGLSPSDPGYAAAALADGNF